ncbi:HAD-superfamily hydrolase, subfamily IA, variant 1 [Anaeromyces robustus]|uniref:HAD-superfamily hydrolase, subfamily IA, variant 1 n=1 Tax=Anaeromyces robustus TaxID=1754192 RepID=A0A1Y1XHW9_9FUNG|nr:HAD-superfamily hydrolase, subfamily IA, variant 1 [Anaeromyces robustus]|eukprot:ORX85333.1 HAD-superfamily hydrolase, subfamily IA, variant 1 [Anaeromyces robustus]
MINTIIFDLDGTLINSIKDLAEACNHALTILNYPIRDIGEYNQLVGNGVMKLFERCLPEGHKTPENIERMKIEFRKYYADHLLDNTLPYEGIKELIEAFIKENEKRKSEGASENELYKLAVATNKPNKNAHTLVNNFFPNQFDVIYGAREGIPTKPSPIIINTILKDLNREANSAVMIGDSNVDIFTGQNAGTRTIGCTWGFRGEDELKNAGAEYIAHTAMDIFNFIKQMN